MGKGEAGRKLGGNSGARTWRRLTSLRGISGRAAWTAPKQLLDAVVQVRKALSALVVGAALACGVSAAGEGLLRPVSEGVSAAKQVELEADPYVVRWRVVGMDREAVFGALPGDEPLVMGLFGDVEVRARVESAKTLDGGSRFLAGVLEGGGHFTLFRHSTGVVRGEFHSGEGVYALRSQGAGSALVTQRDVSAMPVCGNGLSGGASRLGSALVGRPPSSSSIWASSERVRSGGRNVSAPASTGSESKPIDVLVVYTQRVEDYEGGLAQVQATIENEMAKTNQVLENSGLSHRRMRLAAMEKVNYEQRESIGTDLAVLSKTVERGPEYEALDEVFPLIEKHQADLVHLFVREGRGTCGNASNYGGNAEYWVQKDCEHSDNVDLCLYNTRRQYWRFQRYSVSAAQCNRNGGYVFTHELGHVLGLWHNRKSMSWGRDNKHSDLNNAA